MCLFGSFQLSPNHQASSKADGGVTHILFLLLPPLVSKSKRKRIIYCDWLDKRNHSFFPQLLRIRKSCPDLFKTRPEQLWRRLPALPLGVGQLKFTLWLFTLRDASAAKIRVLRELSCVDFCSEGNSWWQIWSLTLPLCCHLSCSI